MPRHSTRRAEGRPSGTTVASVIACAFLISAKASCCQLARSGSGSSGRGSGSAGLVTLFLQERERAGHVRRAHRRRRVQIGLVDRRETIDAEEPEADADLLFEELEHAHEARLAGGGETAARQAPDADDLRAERDALHD